MKKALLLVQGVNHGIYLKDALNEVNFNFANYDEVVEVPTEEVFDGRVLKNKKTNIWDWVGDAYQFYAYRMKRKAVCKLTRNYILDLQENGYEIDAIAHSLGCQILITCGSQKKDHVQVKVNKTILLGSPMGLGFRPLRALIRSQAKRFSKNFYTKQMNYFWSSEDFISKIYDDQVAQITESLNQEYLQIDCKTSHSVQDYYSFIENNSKNV